MASPPFQQPGRIGSGTIDTGDRVLNVGRCPAATGAFLTLQSVRELRCGEGRPVRNSECRPARDTANLGAAFGRNQRQSLSFRPTAVEPHGNNRFKENPLHQSDCQRRSFAASADSLVGLTSIFQQVLDACSTFRRHGESSTDRPSGWHLFSGTCSVVLVSGCSLCRNLL